MLTPDDIITGEKFQDLADISFSKAEHKEFESNNVYHNYDIDNFNPALFLYAKPKFIYGNSSLINLTKKNY